MAQSEPAAAPEEARRRRCRLRRADRRGEAAAPGPEGLGSLSSGSTSTPRRRRAEAAAAAGERVRERASRVGEGRRPPARGQSARRTVQAAARTRARRTRTPSPACLPSPSRLPSVPVARGLLLFSPSPMATARAADCSRVRARSRRGGGSARLGFSPPPRVRPRRPSRGCPFRHFLGGEAAGLCSWISSPESRRPLASPSLPRACGPARSLPDSWAPRSPLPHA